MRRNLQIIGSGFSMAWQELKNNKLRTLLSLLGITFGIFCIISVLATTGSLETNVRESMKSLGSNTVYIQKWPWGGGGEYPWWKYMSRPQPQFDELQPIKEKSQLTKYASFAYFNSSDVEYGDDILQNVTWYGMTEEFNQIQPIEIGYGRYISNSEFFSGSPVVVMGYMVAEKIFDQPEKAVDKYVRIKGRNVLVVGVTKKQGSSMIGGWDFDNIVMLPYKFCDQIGNVHRLETTIIVKGKENIPVEDLKGELKGIMRSVRRLSPKADDNFALNDITSGSSQLNNIFGNITLGGLAITILSFIVGIFGVANIMFVTVKERTSIIGLKKAIGAKKRVILGEFLMESAFLCLIGGLIGLIMVFGMTFALSALFHFKIVISIPLFIGAIVTCIFTGMLAGFLPALSASRLDPVVAIRSK